MPQITVLELDPVVPVDRFGPWLAEAGASVRVVALHASPVPGLDAVGDGLVVLGGRMSAHDADAHAWLPELAALMRAAVDADLPLLGVCLGHQVLAEALGGEVGVALADQDEDGPVVLAWTDAARTDPLTADASAAGAVVPASHHDAVVRLPEGATLLASSARCPVHAFRIGSAVGVQFHPEASPELMGRWQELQGREAGPMLASMRAVDAEVGAVGRALARSFVNCLG